MANGNNEETPVKPSEMSEEELPDVRAFQDEFTRGFMKSTEEVEDGFYVFESGTGLYEMWWIEGTVIDERGYSIEAEDTFEVFIAEIENDNGSFSELRLEFNNILKKESIDNVLEGLNKQSDEKLKFDKKEFEEKDVYIAPLKYRVDEGYGDTLSYIVFIQNKIDMGGTQMIYSTFCKEGGNLNCKEIEEEEREKVESIAYSFEFLSNVGQGDGE